MYQQTYDPLGNAFLSTLVAAIPILTLLYFIALHRHRDSDGTVRLGIPAPWAALFGVIAAFVVVRALDRYGDPRAWQVQAGGFGATLMDFLNTTKYPPSLLFLLMTLGPAAIVCAYADRFSGWVKDTLVMYGRVPFAFYVAHFYLAHALAVAIGVWQGYTVSQMSTLFRFFPKGFGLGLPGVYAVWLLVIVLLYPLCRWVAAVKERRTDWWLSYV